MADPVLLQADGPVRCTFDAGVAQITLDNPPLNVVNRRLTEALGRTLEALAAEDAVRAVVVTGAGSRAFCAGSDIAEFQPWMQPGRIGPEKLSLQHAVFARLDDFPKPTIAAIHGVAFGGGLEIAVCCDLIVADAQARFALPEIRLGLFPSSGGPVRVARRIGEGRAKEMMFFGEPIDAPTALAWGLANRVAPSGLALDTALSLARDLARGPALALALCKQAIGLAFDGAKASAIAAALPLSERVFTSAESQEGVRAFFARTPPVFPNAMLHSKE
ncbi:enoyl-CoA hydratase/isomerase family protein [Pigmentiphaga litoralis]|uniref:Enoyl-CoA hydratase/carnithine racemase n=1 Tax=Pigmentiphaga litoralis TaxID=516702 RepID=A0A7Y9IZB3_9BURK|nr:enoyl-CoA hydratase-related protein [Pigmentiphaga litoralis]NYE26742.1 enoyl-CoA hydratase/carnithine racemase [Pigmentiphaga litoralis]NYE85848.1 enoyl-CoA hydratase/carnithine racemase [Pigmentiphaga litoralis]